MRRRGLGPEQGFRTGGYLFFGDYSPIFGDWILFSEELYSVVYHTLSTHHCSGWRCIKLDNNNQPINYTCLSLDDLDVSYQLATGRNGKVDAHCISYSYIFVIFSSFRITTITEVPCFPQHMR